MLIPQAVWRPLALAALLSTAGAAQAAITVYTSQATFLAAVLDPGVDSFDGLAVDATTTGPITRSAGIYGYTATAIGDTTLFFGSGTAANPALSTNSSTATIKFGGFTGAVTALGANFYTSDVNGAYQPGDLTLQVTDASGTRTFNLQGFTASTFVGFKSDGLLTSVSVTAVLPTTGDAWPSVDNLTLAVNPVPEPTTLGLMLAGLGLVGAAARRRT